MTIFNEYSVEWSPSGVDFKFNGEVVEHRGTDDRGVEFLDKEEKVYFNFWQPDFDMWGAGFDPSTLPIEMRVNQFDAYSWDDSTNEFVLEWSDNFDTLDESRWQVSNEWNFD